MPPHVRLQRGRGRGQVERAAAPGAKRHRAARRGGTLVPTPRLPNDPWHPGRRPALRRPRARAVQRARLAGDHLHRGALEGVGARAVRRHHRGRGALPLLGRRHAAPDGDLGLEGDHGLEVRGAAGADARRLRGQLLRLGARLHAPSRPAAGGRRAQGGPDHQRLHAHGRRAHVWRGARHPRRGLLPAAHLHPLGRRRLARHRPHRLWRRLADRACRGEALHLAHVAQAGPARLQPLPVVGPLAPRAARAVRPRVFHHVEGGLQVAAAPRHPDAA
mmetsp:Transcript_9683/g.24083  ORF Transcript_9683/g.24083 Transcript_9683/m.24083 type:complete len:275 (+) Transcript_9683:1555-2379(+)